MNPPTTNLAFPHAWRAEVLAAAPLIAPARHFTYPRQISGEEDALARGALQLLIHPENDGEKNVRVPHSSTASSSMSGMIDASPFLATCALGFTDPSMPTGLYSCPNPHELCAVAGGYAYILSTTEPERSTHIALRPVTGVLPIPAETWNLPASDPVVSGLLIFAGFHNLVAWGREGLAWQTARLSWEGLRLTGVRRVPHSSTASSSMSGEEGTTPGGIPWLCGFGWNMLTDREVEFAVDLRTGAHTGGGYG